MLRPMFENPRQRLDWFQTAGQIETHKNDTLWLIAKDSDCKRFGDWIISFWDRQFFFYSECIFTEYFIWQSYQNKNHLTNGSILILFLVIRCSEGCTNPKKTYFVETKEARNCWANFQQPCYNSHGYPWKPKECNRNSTSERRLPNKGTFFFIWMWRRAQ